MDIKTVKMDFRRVKYGKKNLIEFEGKLKRMEEYVTYLEGCRQTKDVRLKLDSSKRVLESRRKDFKRKESGITKILDTYRGAIERLPELDRKILMEGYVEGTAYHQIGQDFGYSERGIQERLVRIFEAISENI